MITLKKDDDDSNIESYRATNDARRPRMCMKKKKKQRHMTKNGPFVSFCPFWPGFGISGLVTASSISSLFTAYCYGNEVSRHNGNKLEATSVTKKASCY